MANRLEPVELRDFTGGLDLNVNQFQLAPNASPEMENIEMSRYGGIYTRKGWTRWNEEDIVDPDLVTWDPRRAILMQLSDGTDLIYLANDHDLYSLTFTGDYETLPGVVCDATPHMADFAVFGDDVYIACGREQPMARRSGITPATLLTAAAAGTWNDDYLTPTHGVAPQAELCESHSGYLFVANIEEDGVDHPNRIRWSHPTSPDDWAETDFLDIAIGGNRITALMSYEDHLLIFKPDSIWALYGYDLDSWQLVEKSSTIGTPSPQCVTRSETAVFFYSGSDRGGVYAYGGERAVEIGTQIRRALSEIIVQDKIWVGWMGRKLWVTVPWDLDIGLTEEVASAFIFDPGVGEGAWTCYTSAQGQLGPLIAGSNIDSQIVPLGVLRNPELPVIVRFDHLNLAADRLWNMAVWGIINIAGEEGYLLTSGADEEIIFSGQEGDEAFDARYRTPWVTADWPTRKKSWRRADYICRISERGYDLAVESFRDYEERNVSRRHTVTVPAAGSGAVWGEFDWGDGTLWGEGGLKRGGIIRRGSSHGMCRALQLRLTGVPITGVHSAWGIDAVVLKVVLRRFR